MILSLALAALAAICAFVMGYALNQGTTCAVTAARQVIDERKPLMLLGFVVAAAAAGLVWLPLAWLSGGLVTLEPDRAVGWGLILGSVLLGVGAVLNRACLLGSVARIGDGRLSYLGLPAGLAMGFLLANGLGLSEPPFTRNLLGHPSEVALLVLIGFAALLWVGWSVMRTLGDRGEPGRWPWRVAMVVLGLAGALLFAVAPGWTLADAVRLALPHGPMAVMAAAGLGLAMFAILSIGAVMSGIRRKSFLLRPARPLAVARSVAGGAVMALGASTVPGGNDALLLAALPSATTSGLAAYAIMSATIFGLLLLRQARPSSPLPGL